MSRRLERHDGPDSYRVAQRMARYGRADWLVWSDATGKHAARKTESTLTELIAAKPEWWLLILASNATPMKGFDWLATNLLAHAREGM